MKRNIVLDLLRLVLAFMVVGIHTHFLHDISPVGSFLTVHGLFTIAVPVFLLISGFYMFPVLEKGEENKWIKRILIIYLVWMAFYAYKWLLDVPDYSIDSISRVVHRFLFGYAHLWYIAGLLGATFLLKWMHRYASSSVMIASVFITFLLGVFIEHINYWHLAQNSTLQTIFSFDWIYRNFLFVSYPFLAIGYLINRYSLHKKISIPSLLFFCVAGIGLILMESYHNFQTHQTNSDNLLSILFAAPVIFLLFMKLNVDGYTKKLALYAASIYFIHIFFVHVFEYLHIDLGETLLTFVVYILSAIASYFIVKLHERVPYIL